MKLLIGIAFGLIVYTYAVYPLVLVVVTGIKRFFVRRRFLCVGENFLPSVTLLIPAYNEEEVIAEKIRNSRALDYPSEKLEILIGSDGSTDRTNEICTFCNLNDLKFFAFPKRRGKASVLNDLVSRSSGDVIVFSDANTLFEPKAIRRLVAHFGDAKVGSVSGRLVLKGQSPEIHPAEGVYWKYETILKWLEGNVSSVVGANGGIYAIRRSLFDPIPADTIIDDFVISMSVIQKGYLLAFEHRALGYEYSSDDLANDFKRKMRIGAGNLQSLKFVYPLLFPRYGSISFLLWSHKIVRWCIPMALLAIYIMPFFVLSTYSSLVLALQYFILATAVIGTRYGRGIKIIRLNTYFFSVNLALFLGYCRFLLGLQKGTWEKAR